jgi:topoisomerase-4 subunit A
MIAFSLSFLDNLLVKYGQSRPRKTEITNFSEVSFRKAALSNLNVLYNRKSGFLGYQIKEDEDTKEDLTVTCSEYDRLFLIYTNGLYKIIPATEKLYVGHDLEWFGVVEKESVFNIIYRDGAENFGYVKRFKTPSFILEKEYRLFPEHKRSKILLLTFGDNNFAKINLMPSSRAKTNSLEIAFDDYLIKNALAKGKRVSNRVIRKVSPTNGISPEQLKHNLPLPGFDLVQENTEIEVEPGTGDDREESDD